MMLAIFLLGAMIILAPSGLAALVSPTLFEGNPSCSEFNFNWIQWKVEPPATGVYGPDANGVITTVTITGYKEGEAIEFSWNSNVGIDAVIVKASTGGQIYDYSLLGSEPKADGGLTVPDKFAISHITFCYDIDPLEVSKTAKTTFTRTYEWDILKSVSPATLDLFRGDSSDVEWKITVTQTGFTDSDWAVSGQITVVNPNAFTVPVSSVTDTLTGGINAGVVCPALSVPPLGKLVCTYGAGLPDALQRLNTATAVSGDERVGSGSGTADVVFGAPTTEINATINVADTNRMNFSFGNSGIEIYNETFTCDRDGGGHSNTATIAETGQSSTATATVNCYALSVSKTAETELTRTFLWEIEKAVAPTELHLFRGDSASSEWKISVTKTGFVDSDWKVSGQITVNNPAPIDAQLTSVSDLISPSIVGTVLCPSLTVPAGGPALVCTYSADLPDASTRSNTATATLQNRPSGTTDFTGSAAVDFIGATVHPVNDSITVSDTNEMNFAFGDSGMVTYSESFSCDQDGGGHTNTATIDQTGQTADAMTTVNCYALEVSKTAAPELTRTYNWNISKTSDRSELVLSTGQSFLVNYAVTVSATHADSDWKVSGTITIANPAPIDASLASVLDEISVGINAAVDCGGQSTVPAGGPALVCTYSADLPNGANRTNTATATLQNTPSGTTDFSGSTAVDFSSATIHQLDECVDVNDDLLGPLGTVCFGDLSGGSFTYNYSYTIGPFYACGIEIIDNTAAFETNDTGSTGSSTWTIAVDVPCTGCTLTIGYWKNHAGFGPQADMVTPLLPQTLGGLFVGDAAMAVDILSMSWDGGHPSNGITKLLAQMLAAKLNVANGASPGAVAAIIGAAEAFLLSTKDPLHPQADWKKLSKSDKKMVLSWMSSLDDYNNGAIGPGHCSE